MATTVANEDLEEALLRARRREVEFKRLKVEEAALERGSGAWRGPRVFVWTSMTTSRARRRLEQSRLAKQPAGGGRRGDGRSRGAAVGGGGVRSGGVTWGPGSGDVGGAAAGPQRGGSTRKQRRGQGSLERRREARSAARELAEKKVKDRAGKG